MMRRNAFVLTVAGVMLSSSASTAMAQNFADPTRANVLRQYNADGTLAVTRTNNTTFDRNHANDGSAQIAFDSTFTTGTAQQTFKLPTDVLVSSYLAQFEGTTRAPAQFQLLGRLRATDPFTVLSTVVPAANQPGTFTPMRVTELQYIATAPASSGQLFLSELQVFADAAQPIGLTASPTSPNNAAYNVLRDLNRVTGTDQSTTVDPAPAGGSDAFKSPQNGLASVTVNGSYQNEDPSRPGFTNDGGVLERFFLTYDLTEPGAGQTRQTQLNYVHIGNNRDQSLIGASIWTSNLDNPLGGVDSDWVLQVTGNASESTATGSGDILKLSQPGLWKHLRITASETGNNVGIVEIEAFGFIPEPASLGFASLGSILLMRRRRPAR